MKLYFVLPVINSEIIATPYIVSYLSDIHDYECLVFQLSFDINLKEVDY